MMVEKHKHTQIFPIDFFPPTSASNSTEAPWGASKRQNVNIISWVLKEE